MKRKTKYGLKKAAKITGITLLALIATGGVAYGLNSHYKWVETPEWMQPGSNDDVTSEELSLKYEVLMDVDFDKLDVEDFTETSHSEAGVSYYKYTLVTDDYTLVINKTTKGLDEIGGHSSFVAAGSKHAYVFTISKNLNGKFAFVDGALMIGWDQGSTISYSFSDALNGIQIINFL